MKRAIPDGDTKSSAGAVFQETTLLHLLQTLVMLLWPASEQKLTGS